MEEQPAAIPNMTIKTPPYAWVVLFATYMASLAAPMNLFKVPPMLTTLEPIFNLSQTAQGYLMSVFSIMGFLLAIPAGFILKRFGVKTTILFAVAALAIGAGMGAVSKTIGLLFFGRFIEGAGMGLIMVSAPLAISLWFPAAKRGLPMGLWASCIGVGNTIMFFLAPVLAAPTQANPSVYHWEKVWWLGSGFAALAFVIFASFFRMPREGETEEAPAAESPGSVPEIQPSLFKAMANRDLLLLSICFLTFNLVIMALNTFYPVFLEVVLSYTKESASSISSLLFLIAIFSAPLGSYISDKIESRKSIIVIPYAVITILFLFPFSMTGAATISIYLIIMALMMGPVSPVILAAVPEVMPSPQTIGIGMGVAACGQNIGMFLGPSLFGSLLETHSWAAVGYIMVPICLIGVVTAWMAKIR